MRAVVRTVSALSGVCAGWQRVHPRSWRGELRRERGHMRVKRKKLRRERGELRDHRLRQRAAGAFCDGGAVLCAECAERSAE